MTADLALLGLAVLGALAWTALAIDDLLAERRRNRRTGRHR